MTINEFFDKATEGLDFTDEQKKELKGLFFIGYYKRLLEALFAAKFKDNTKVQQKIIEVLLTSVDLISDEQKEKFGEVMDEAAGQVLIEIVGTLKDNLPTDLQAKMEQNLSSLSLQ